jgi:hypothetical protein
VRRGVFLEETRAPGERDLGIVLPLERTTVMFPARGEPKFRTD